MSTESFAVRQGAGAARRDGFLDKYFYFGMSYLVAAVVVYGFSHTIDHNLIHATPARPWLLWVHGILFTSWLVFFSLQSLLVRTRNVKVHRTLGWFGVAMGALITIVGLSTAIVMDRFDVALYHQPMARDFFVIQLLDMTSFTSAFWLAIYWRKKPEFHRRLMLIATCVLTAAAFSRFPYVGPVWAYVGVDSLVVLGVLRDVLVNARVHKVYRVALPALVVWQVAMVQILLHDPLWWRNAMTWLMG